MRPDCPRQMTLSDCNCFTGQARFWAAWGTVGDGHLAAWQVRYGIDRHSFAADPMFVDEKGHDLHLRRGSPCIDRGRPVATAVGTGTESDTITVTNAYYFTDGNGIIPGDRVQIGRGPAAQTAAVVKVVDDRAMKLDRKVSWKPDDWITLPFVGDAPDIGAYELGDDREVIGPTWQHYPRRDLLSATGIRSWGHSEQTIQVRARDRSP